MGEHQRADRPIGFRLAVSANITYTFLDPQPVPETIVRHVADKDVPAVGAEIKGLIGTYDSYTQNPAQIILRDGEIQKEEPERYQKMVPDGIHPSSTSSVAVTWPAIEAL